MNVTQSASVLSSSISIPSYSWREWKTWAVMALIWTLPAVVALSYYYLNQIVTGQGFNWTFALITTVPNWYMWALMTPIAVETARRLPLEVSSGWMRAVLLHGGVMVILMAIHSMGNVLAFRAVGIHDTVNASLFETHFTARLQINIFTYVMVVGVFYAVDYFRKYQIKNRQTAELKVQLTNAQLRALKMQLQPHFLFNTLNSVSALVRKEENQNAIRMIGKLADFLRLALESTGEQEVTLQQEVAFAKRYLDIEQLRFHERLQIRLELDSETMTAYIPNLVLQPLVENAIKHGIAPHKNTGTITIRSYQEKEFLILEVDDDGPGLTEPGRTSGTGVGLVNTRERLRELYGENQQMDLGRTPEGGFRVRIKLPLMFSPSLPVAV